MPRSIPLSSQQIPPLSRPLQVVLHSPRSIGLCAIQALHQELATFPKPGLVSPVDSGSHRDMNAALFFRSLFSLRTYFCDIALAGLHGALFAELKTLGIAAEARMLQATNGVNTHRGAIFNLGLLAAAAGHLQATGMSLQKDALGVTVGELWGDAIRQHANARSDHSHGSQVATRHGAGGALQEACSGFPNVFCTGLPALQHSLDKGAGQHNAAVQCLFSLMAELVDTNLLFRGGEAGLNFAQQSASDFLAEGGVHRPGWQAHALEIHRQFVRFNLSPGGSADLLAASLFVNHLQGQALGTDRSLQQ